MPAPAEFHMRGRHVQHAHGRRSAALADGGDHLNGAMIALLPTAADAKRLAVKGGETVADLHLTLFFLGGDATVFGHEDRAGIVSAVRAYMSDLSGPVTAKIFGAAHWNGDGDTPSWVWSVGDDPDGDVALELVHALAVMALESLHSHPELPVQHSPWVPHVCAAYTGDLSLIGELEKRLGPVTFDRVRVTFGGDATDIVLGENVTAAALLRRKPRDFETGVDFEAFQAQWETAVDTAVTDLAPVMRKWRSSIREQVETALTADDPDRLVNLSISAVDARVVIEKRMAALAQQAGERAQREAEAQGVDVPEWDVSSLTAALAGRDLLRSVARMTADALSGRVLASAKQRITQLLGLTRTPQAAADDVSEHLADMSDAPVRAALGTAMTTAQNTGRRAVFEVAPPAEYYASEILDKNTCGPCRKVDGDEYADLQEAIRAYPVSGFKDCIGSRYGNNCRGMVIARWPEAAVASGTMPTAEEAITMPWHVARSDECGSSKPWAVIKDSTGEVEGCHATKSQAEDQMAALYASEGKAVTMTETMGGKPNQGTKKDKRLKENAYDDGMDCPEGEDCPDEMMTGKNGHFTTDEIVQLEWDGSASRFTDAEYERATAACDPGEGTVKERCFLPHHEPGGALNEDGVHAAAQRVSALEGHSPAAVARAKAHLRSHYGQMDEEVPDVLKATIADEVELALEARSFAPVETVETYDGEDTSTFWRGPIVVEGQVTGDGREFAKGALTWQDPPVPLRWNKEDSHGGEPRTTTVNVGKITRMWREGDLIMGEGEFDLSTEDGRTACGKVRGEYLKGISIDADSIENADVEYVWPEDVNPGTDEETDLFELLFAQPEKIVFHGGRIRAATLCDIPAFAEAYIAIVDGEGAVLAGGQTHPELVPQYPARVRRAVDGLRASGGPRDENWLPPAAWFRDPQLSMPTNVQVTDDGRVYGHAALWGSCHIGQTDVCVQPPREEQHSYYTTGEVATREGTRVSVGQITVGTGHAPLSMSAVPATEHYDNTGSAVADVSVGNDAHGIWIAGAIRSGADPAMVHALRAAGAVSGDWRRIGAKLRLVGLLAVNVPGFSVPNMRARVASGVPEALVAAGRPVTVHTVSERERVQEAFKIVMDKLFNDVHEGR